MIAVLEGLEISKCPPLWIAYLACQFGGPNRPPIDCFYLYNVSYIFCAKWNLRLHSGFFVVSFINVGDKNIFGLKTCV